MAQDVKSTALLPRALASGTEQFLSVTEGTRVFVMRLAREKPLGMAGGIIVVLMGLAALLADFIAPYPYAETHYADALSEPTATYLFGTDNLGRDVLSRIIYGARISVYVGLGAVALGVIYALVLGLLAAWFGGAVDTIISRFVDAKLAIPTLLLLLVVAAVLGPGLLNIILVLSLFGMNEARIVRGHALSVKNGMYIEASEAIGCSSWRIVTRHLLPNVMPLVVILGTLRFGTVILAEATLSFLGYGIPPPFPSWGGMLGTESRFYLQQAPWLALAPGLALMLVVWGFNMLGDALRDLLDPRLRGTGQARFH